MTLFERREQPEEFRVLPIQIAVPCEAIRVESNRRLRLWVSLELLETTVKWLFAVMIAGVYERDCEFSRSLSNTISSAISTPGLGKWIDMAAAASREIRAIRSDDAFGIPFADVFDRYGSDAEVPLTWHGLKELRNKVVHGGGLTEGKARELAAQVEGSISVIIAELAAVHREYDTMALFDGKAWRLEGLQPTLLGPEDPMPPAPGTWIIRRDGVAAGLQPLLTYEPIREFWEIDLVRTVDNAATQSAVPQWYFNFEKGKLYYTPIGVDDFITVRPDTTAFERLFLASQNKRTTTILEGQYRRAQQKHMVNFVGRTSEIEAALGWIKASIPAGNKLGLIVGPPGVGKSALLTATALSYRAELEDIRSRRNHALLHVFSSDDPQNDRRTFLMSLRQELQRWLGRRVESTANLTEPDALLQSVQGLLESASMQSGPRHLTIFVDALDEVRLFDPAFSGMLVKLLRNGVTILATTRGEPWLKELETAGTVERVVFRAGHDGLPGMSEADIRAILLERLGERSRQLIALDQDVPDQAVAHNPFVASVVRLADGKPIYVELLIADILAETAKIEAHPRLPKSLEDFYGKLLGRQGVGDAKAHLAMILCLLALASEPVDEEWLAFVLSLSPAGRTSPSSPSRWVQAALNDGRVFLNQTETPAGTPGFTLYHQELGRFLEGEGFAGAVGLHWAMGHTRWLLTAATEQAAACGNEAIVLHFLRHGAKYVLLHGDAVRPEPTSLKPTDYALANYFSRDKLPSILAAWFADLPAFLYSYTETLASFRKKAEPDKTEQATSDLAWFILHEPSLHQVAGIVHSILGYREQEHLKRFYDELLVAVVAEPLGPEDIADVPGFRRIDWSISAAGAARREGALDAAEEFLDRAVEGFAACRVAKNNAWHNTWAKLHYERGYVAFFRSELDVAAMSFDQSTAAARSAGNRVSAHISQAVGMRMRVLEQQAMADPAPNHSSEFRRFLEHALQQLLEIARSGKDEHDRLNAERWVMNCRAHLFEASWYLRDGQAGAWIL